MGFALYWGHNFLLQSACSSGFYNGHAGNKLTKASQDLGYTAIVRKILGFLILGLGFRVWGFGVLSLGF